jgi:mannuronan synthase
VKHLFAGANPPDRVKLEFVRIAGTGKRDGLANAFRAVAASAPPADAVACVVDGDTILTPGLLRGCVPLFKLFPKAMALTTDEVCDVVGARIFREWYSMRFAQRQVLMCSIGLSRHVLTLTGRMSAFRASVLTDPEFISRVEEDFIEHWRFGRLKFLTGDDKSSWYHILEMGGEMLYVPDVHIKTVEVPPLPSFVGSATVLMIRWFGNMLRTNGRAIALGPRRMGLFTWWCVLDQRISMWTSLVGPVAAIGLALSADPFILALYILWVALTRFLQTLVLLTMRSEVSAYYPFLLYFNQIYGSMVKVFVLFRLDRQKWTRQNTVGGLGLSGLRNLWKGASTLYLNVVAVAFFVIVVSTIVGALPNLSIDQLQSFVRP